MTMARISKGPKTSYIPGVDFREWYSECQPGVVSSLERSEAPHSSSRGTESFFRGATLILAVTRATVGGESE